MTAPDAPNLLPADATWAGIVLLVIAGWFLAALTIGIVARLVMPEKFTEIDLPAKAHTDAPEPQADPANEVAGDARTTY